MKQKISIKIETSSGNLVQIDAWESGEMDVMSMVGGDTTTFEESHFADLSKDEMSKIIADKIKTLLPL